MSPLWKTLTPALLGALLVLVAVVRLWHESAGTEAGAVMLGSGLTLLALATWAAIWGDRDR